MASFPDEVDVFTGPHCRMKQIVGSYCDKRPYVCSVEGCDKGFTRNFHLARHQQTHTGEKPFLCSTGDCKETFTTNSNLRKHVARIHENQEKKYVCVFEGCGMSFKKHQQLRVHECHHTNELPFKCTHEGCGMRFVFPSKLKRHQKVHEGYPCKEEGCLFVGKTWTEYQRHVHDSHVEEQICNVCNKAFLQKDQFKQHKKTHMKERDVFVCPTEGCGRKYTTVFNLQSHILSFHEEQRPFICEYAGCGKTFAMKQSLERHAVIHDPEKRKLKVRRPQRSLASRLSGYADPKSKSKKAAASSKNNENAKIVGVHQESLSVQSLTIN